MNGVDIKGYDGKYTIFPDGSCRRNPSKYRRKTMFLKPLNGTVYLRYGLSDGHGNIKYYSIHRLVAEHFIPNPDNKPTVNHKDGNKHNNNIDNLEWATWTENEKHSIDVLKRNRNTDCQRESASLVCKAKRKLSMKEANEIRLSKLPRKELARIYGVSRGIIDRIKRNESYID